MRTLIFLIFIIMIICSPALSTTVHSNFTCDSTSNTTTLSFYSYLKEPALEESQYHKGYKSKSFDYLNKGTIKFQDQLVYFDGKKDDTHQEKETLNSSVYHYNKVFFDGNYKDSHGISEVYDAAFFPNNRAISAFKKIRYDDLTYNFSRLTGKSQNSFTLNTAISKYSLDVNNTYKFGKQTQINKILPNKGSYKLGNSTTAKYIDSTSEASMGIPQGYTLDYYANFKDATFEMNEATGWSNKTGARRTDWDQSALIHGDAKVSNLLEIRGYFFPEAGPSYDWLPCNFCGTIPDIEQNDSGWPVNRTLSWLKADTLFPTTQLVPVTQLVQSPLIPTYLAAMSQSSISRNDKMKKAEIGLMWSLGYSQNQTTHLALKSSVFRDTKMKWAGIGLISLLPDSHLMSATNCSSGACSLKNLKMLEG